ncbi:MAG TPA: FtsX-like permease family protein [Bacteroidales bacterium]|nr:FtsX-like permease family protein [Bacteroidales bacterium]
MLRFFIKGLLRDRQRSLLPIIVVTLGVMLAVLMQAWITGILGDIIDFNSRFATGHVKIMSRAYNDIKDQKPNDLALLEASGLISELKSKYPDMIWAERISFGGLIDSPDENGETREQGPAMGMAVDLLSENSREVQRLNLQNILVRGELPDSSNEVLISELFSQRLKVNPGDQVTLITSTMYGAMSITNFTVTGTIKFGAPVLDRGGILADISGIREAMDMEDAVGEILGYFGEGEYDDEKATALSSAFNSADSDPEDLFSPLMVELSEQDELISGYLNLVGHMQRIVITIFLVAMAIVLWNAGLLGGLRRYGEMGLRMAIGEHKGHIYRSLISESLVIGIVGSVAGTAIGLFFARLLENGLDFSSMLEGSTMMMSGIYKARITPETYYIGFIPGILATFLGTALAGIGIYRRQTAQLFKELQA